MDVIEVKDVYKCYGKGENEIRALDGVSFSLSRKQLTVILGPSGSGKSTLLNILGGMDAATGGSIKLDGRELTQLKESDMVLYRRFDIGFVFQFYNLMPNLTALENVLLCQNANSILSAKEVLEQVGLKHRLHNFPAQLSGGEQQRVAIARAIVKNPKLLLCDEPTGALDSKSGCSILILLQRIAKENESTVVVVTHNPKLSLAADRVIRLSDGRIIENKPVLSPMDAQEIDFE